jgi:hypothetical protein
VVLFFCGWGADAIFGVCSMKAGVDDSRRWLSFAFVALIYLYTDMHAHATGLKNSLSYSFICAGRTARSGSVAPVLTTIAFARYFWPS